jgi:hypothetical protein
MFQEKKCQKVIKLIVRKILNYLLLGKPIISSVDTNSNYTYFDHWELVVGWMRRECVPRRYYPVY